MKTSQHFRYHLNESKATEKPTTTQTGEKHRDKQRQSCGKKIEFHRIK